MNLEKVIFGFVIVLAATLNFGFVYGDPTDPGQHHLWEFFAVFVVNVIATALKFGDRTQIGAVHLSTSLVAVLQLAAAALVWFFAPPGPLSEDTIGRRAAGKRRLRGHPHRRDDHDAEMS
jgi:hypothetical protein